MPQDEVFHIILYTHVAKHFKSKSEEYFLAKIQRKTTHKLLRFF